MPQDSATLEERIDALSRHWRVVKPAGAGPFPVVVQLHGCGGVRTYQADWAEAARVAGAAAIIVDSLAPRGISLLEAYATVCTGLRLPGRARAGDMFAALAWARRQDWADSEKLVAAGWSHGGWTIADALSLRDSSELARATGLRDLPDEPLAGLTATFLVYPYLGLGVLRGRPWRLTPRTLAIIGGKDSVAGGAWPYRMLERVRAQGASVEIVSFENAAHSFDEPDTPLSRFRYDAALSARARNLYTAFLRSL